MTFPVKTFSLFAVVLFFSFGCNTFYATYHRTIEYKPLADMHEAEFNELIHSIILEAIGDEPYRYIDFYEPNLRYFSFWENWWMVVFWKPQDRTIEFRPAGKFYLKLSEGIKAGLERNDIDYEESERIVPRSFLGP